MFKPHNSVLSCKESQKSRKLLILGKIENIIEPPLKVLTAPIHCQKAWVQMNEPRLWLKIYKKNNKYTLSQGQSDAYSSTETVLRNGAISISIR